MKNSQTKSSVDLAVPQSDAADQLKENEKRALELQELAEHEVGETRKNLEEKARQNADE